MAMPPAPVVRRAGWSLAGALLALPAIAMQLGGDVQWGPGDFLAAALLLGATGAALEIIAALPHRRWRSRGAVLAIAVLLLIWAELAVGIFH